MLGFQRPDLARDAYLEAINILHDGPQQRTQALQTKAVEMQTAAIFLDISSEIAGRSSRRAGQVLSKGLEAFSSGTMGLSQQLFARAAHVREVRSGEATGDFFRMPVVQAGAFEFVGQLVSPTGRCTSFQVKWRIVVTNAHCVVSDDGTVYRPDQLEIVTHHTNIFEPFWTGQGITTRIDKVIISGEYLENRNFADDWAVLVTSTPINWTAELVDNLQAKLEFAMDALSSEKELPMRIEFTGKSFRNSKTQQELDIGLSVRDVSNQIEKGASIAIAGYSGDINSGDILMLDYGCPMLATREVYSYQCSAYGGNSGGPIFAGNFGDSLTKLGDRVRPLTVIGVHACGARDAEPSLKTDRSELFGCGVHAAKFLPTVEREFALLP